MSELTSKVIVTTVMMFILFGWIPILAIGKAISMCVEAKTCNKCSCKNCCKEELNERND